MVPGERVQHSGIASSMVIVLLVAAALYISNMGRMIEYDEAFTLRHYAGSPFTALLVYTAPNNHLLNSLAIWFASRLMGTSEIAVRLPAMAWGLCSVALIFRIAQRLRDRSTGLLAAGLLATVPRFAHYAFYARGYTLTIFLLLLLTEHLLFGIHKSRYWLVLLSMALMMVMPSNGLITGAAVLWLFWHKRYANIPPVVVGTIAGSLWYLPSLILGGVDRHNALAMKNPADLVRGLIGTVYPIEALILLLVAGAVGVWFVPRSMRRWIFLCVVCAAVMAPIQYWITESLFYPRNYLYLLPLLVLIGAAGAMAAIRWNPGLTAAMVLAVLRASAIAANSLPGPRHALYEMVRNSNETVVIGCCYEEPIWYYMAKEHPERFLPKADEPFVVIVDSNKGSTLAGMLDLYQIERVTCTPASDWPGFEAWRCVKSDGE